MKIDSGDVRIEKLDPRYCDECGKVATRLVLLDLRGCGLSIPTGIYCSTCATVAAHRVSECLPGRSR